MKLARTLMWIQFALMLIVFLGMFPEPRLSAPGIGGAFFATGLALLLWSFKTMGKSLTPDPIPKTNAKLVTQGPYEYIRHPIYSGAILCSLGWSLMFGTAVAFLATMALIPTLAAKARLEEKFLLAKYPEYATYKAKTGRFLPKPSRSIIKADRS